MRIGLCSFLGCTSSCASVQSFSPRCFRRDETGAMAWHRMRPNCCGSSSYGLFRLWGLNPARGMRFALRIMSVSRSAICGLALRGTKPGNRTGPNPTRWQPQHQSRRVRCNRIQLDAMTTGPTSPVFFFRLRLSGFRLRASGSIQQIPSGSRNTFASSSAGARPSGNVPRLYSAMRFFHLRKSVMLCGSTRTSTRRRLASSRFIS